MTSEANTASGEDPSSTTAAPPQAAKSEKEATADELAAPPESVNMTDEEELGAANSKDNSDSGKLKALFGILKRMVGVKDLAAIRLSLPANLLEPVPNLEYWNYLDRGDLFTTIGDFDDPLDRMLASLRFTFTKELKFVHGKICKPYNSILGEHFRCHWDVVIPDVREDGSLVPKMNLLTKTPSVMPRAGTPQASTPQMAPKKTRKQEQKSSGGGSATPSESGTSERSATSKGQSGTSTAASSPGVPAMSSLSAISTNNSTEDSSSSGRPSAKRGLSKFLSAASGRNKASSRSSVQSSTTSSPTTPSKSPADPADEVSKMTLDGGVVGSSGAETSNKDGVEKDEDNEAEDEVGDDESVAGSFKTTKSTAEVARRRICFLTEQVSHHPPISSFFVECKEAGIQLYGVDQLSAKFTGTTIRIFPGDQNQGVFVKLTDGCKSGAAGEEYQITHPTASINGLLRGSLWVAICDTLYITCRGGSRGGESSDTAKQGSRLRTIVEYKDESWVMKAKYALEAVIYEYDEAQGQSAEEYEKIRQVPQERVVATLEGTWKGQVFWRRKGEKESKLLIDLDQLLPVDTRAVRPLTAQEPMESRKIWEPVTQAILNKEFGAATKHKQEIEQMQRDKAAERKRNNEDFVPRFFIADISDGRPKLTEAGKKALDGEAQLEGYNSSAEA